MPTKGYDPKQKTDLLSILPEKRRDLDPRSRDSLLDKCQKPLLRPWEFVPDVLPGEEESWWHLQERPSSLPGEIIDRLEDSIILPTRSPLPALPT